MKKTIIYTLSAIALAVPLGIGGLILAAPVTATNADANAIRHHFNTCSRDVIWKCHGRVQSAILFNTGYNRIFPSRAMPEGANGLDRKTFGTLDWQSRNRWGPGSGVFAGLYLQEFFSDADIRDFNESVASSDRFTYSTSGYISPDDRARFVVHLAAVQERQRQEDLRRAEEERARLIEENYEITLTRFRGDCTRYNGVVVFHSDVGMDGAYRCEGGTGNLTQFTGFNPDNPNVYTIALVDELVGTCSTEELQYCSHTIREHVVGEYRSLFNGTTNYDLGSNGADQATFEALTTEMEILAQSFTPTNDARRILILAYLRAAFPDPYQFWEHRSNYPYQARAFISPNDRAALEAIYAGELEAEAEEERQRIAREAEEAERRRIEAQAAEVVRRRKLVAFKRECAAEGERERSSYDFFDDRFDRQVCVIFRHETLGGSPIEDRYQFWHTSPDLGLPFLAGQEVAFQISPVLPLNSLAEIEDIADHRQATSVNRSEIVELQEEVTDHEDRLLELEPAVARNVQVIGALGNSVGVLSEAVTGIAEDTEKNAAGISLAYALDAPGLSYGKRFAITGALGQFRGESAVGFSGTFKAGEFVLISVGGGFAGSGDSSVTGGRLSATYEW